MKHLKKPNHIIYEFLKKYFEDYQILYKPEDKNKGAYLIERKLESFRNDKKKQIKYLKKVYRKLYPYNDLIFLESYRGSKNIICSWKNWVLNVLENNLAFTDIFLERVKPYDNPEKDFFFKDNFYHFYNLHMDVIGGVAYKNIDEVVELLETWKRYYILDHKLTWIDCKITELKTKGSGSDKINLDGKTLKDFLDEDFYNKMIQRMEADELIGEDLNLIPTVEDGWIERRAAAYIGWLLKKQHKLTPKLNQKELVRVLSNTFNVNLSESNFSDAKKKFKKLDNKKNDNSYLCNYSFISNL